jgi:hypothetical protein
MAATCCTAGYVIEVVDAFYLEGDLAVFFYEGEIASDVMDYWKIDNFTFA